MKLFKWFFRLIFKLISFVFNFIIKKLIKKDYFYSLIDLETTGLFKNDKIVEISIRKFIDFEFRIALVSHDLLAFLSNRWLVWYSNFEQSITKTDRTDFNTT